MLKEFNLYTQIALIIVIVGGICWGLVGIADFYLVSAIFGYGLGKIIYIIVALAAFWLCYQIYIEKTKKI